MLPEVNEESAFVLWKPKKRRELWERCGHALIIVYVWKDYAQGASVTKAY